MLRKFFVIPLTLILALSASAQIKVRTSEELKEVLTSNKDVGVVLLDGDWFHLEGIQVNIGGTIKPYGNRKPVLVGFQQTVNRNKDTRVQGGYWTAHVTGYGAAHYIFLDQNFEAIKRATTVDGKEFMYLMASDLQRTDKATRFVKIKVPSGYASLLNKSESDLKNAMLKVGYWFVQFNIYNLKSDGKYLYGQIDNSYNYELLDIRSKANVTVSFFNFPSEDGGIFFDGKDILHVPVKYSTVRMCCSNNILTLNGNRTLAIEGITFTGSMKPIVIQGANKHIYNCSFKNCGDGVFCDYGTTNKESKCSVKNCRFDDLYNNNAISFVGCDDVLIANNITHNTGLVNKSGSVIRVGGKNFKVEHNEIKGYSYMGISVGTRDLTAKITGYINDNLVDNAENWGLADKQLSDGGGIYVITHTDGIVVENNIVRNIGYENSELWGIYFDDGAYNCTVRHNLVYNIWPGQYAMTSRLVEECERSCINNVFEDNIFIGPCKIAGNRRGLGKKTIIRNNYIAGDLNTQGDEFVFLDGNKFISAAVGKDGKIVTGKGERIKKRGFSRSIKKLIKR